MATTLESLCQLVGGQLAGNGTLEITGAATLETARTGEITFIDSSQKAQRLTRSSASAVVVPKDFPEQALPTIAVDDVHGAFAQIVSQFIPHREPVRCGLSRLAAIDPSATIGDQTDVYPGVTIGRDVRIGQGCVIHAGAQIMDGCQIGDDVVIYPGAVLYENTVVGARSILHAGVVLGAFGFGYKTADGKHLLSAQLGNVEVGEEVEIGANTTIDRGTYGPTVIGSGTKIDNQVMIAHNCRIGRHNMICSQVGIAGSTTTGDYVVMAGQVGVRDHVHIGDGAVLGAMAGVVNDVPAGSHMLGAPAIPEREQKINFAMLAKLPEMRRQLKQLSQAIAQLNQGQLNQDS